MRSQMGLETNVDVRKDEADLNDDLFMSCVARVYLLRLLEEVVAEEVHQVMSEYSN